MQFDSDPIYRSYFFQKNEKSKGLALYHFRRNDTLTKDIVNPQEQANAHS